MAPSPVTLLHAVIRSTPPPIRCLGGYYINSFPCCASHVQMSYTRPVLSTYEYVSPVSYLTNTCLACSNGRTVVGALDIQTFCMLIAVRSVTVRPSFLPSSTNKLTWLAVWLTHNQEALEPGGCVWNIKQYKYKRFHRLSITDGNILPVPVRTWRSGRPPVQSFCRISRRT